MPRPENLQSQSVVSAARCIASAHGATPSQVAIAWLLQRSPVIVPIPGTSKVAHLEENVTARDIVLSDEEFAALDEMGKPKGLGHGRA